MMASMALNVQLKEVMSRQILMLNIGGVVISMVIHINCIVIQTYNKTPLKITTKQTALQLNSFIYISLN